MSVVCAYNDASILNDWLLRSLRAQTAEYEIITIGTAKYGFHIYLEALMMYFEIKDDENYEHLFQKAMSAVAKACLPLTYDFNEESIEKITLVRNEIQN